MLAVVGTAGMHQRNFPLFLTAVLGVSILAVVIFVATAPRGGPGNPS